MILGLMHSLPMEVVSAPGNCSDYTWEFDMMDDISTYCAHVLLIISGNGSDALALSYPPQKTPI